MNEYEYDLLSFGFAQLRMMPPRRCMVCYGLLMCCTAHCRCEAKERLSSSDSAEILFGPFKAKQCASSQRLACAL